jgi:zinc resistance-associated protein
MLKPVIAATAVVAIVGGSAVYAQQRFGEHNGPGGRWHARAERHLNAADMAAFTDARIAALKAGLQLTPDQAKNWPPFEHALRDAAQLRISRIEARQAQRQQGAPAQVNPFDRLARRADNLSATGAALKKVAAAGAPLYQSLNDAQKERFHVLARFLRPRPRQVAFLQRRESRHAQGRQFGRHGGFGQQHRLAPDGGAGSGGGSQL